jgi:uncharacterized protein YbbK (DUF523 family)
VIRIGISACLLGQRVRYDGAHKLNEFVVQSLGRVFEFVPFCPEVGIGLGVPRPPIQLTRVGATLRARGVSDPELDVTEALIAYANRAAPALDALSGFVFKERSPSCGVAGIDVHDSNGSVRHDGVGIFARQLMRCAPQLPIAEAEWLKDRDAIERFIQRVLA